MESTDNFWRQTRALFREALRQPTGQQTQFIMDSDDAPDVQTEALALLGAAEKTGQPFESIVTKAAAAMNPSQSADTLVGRYRLKRLIGEGGMGEVYLAKRADDRFDQQVALKLLAIRKPNDAVVARFEAERQILANLEHPNIARLLDGGETDEGVPYLVMEYVDGEAIDVYCDARKLDTRARITLFLDVCRAVDHAHRNLVIHRDIKPSNILVSRDDQTKLLDFGIAKLLQSDANAELTRPSDRVLSPMNASPEQVRGESITVATDIYSLGILLYQLLTGCHPYSEHLDSARSVEHAICETDPERPSARLTQTNNPSRYRETHNASIDALARELGGDLDNIVLKALSKEPERRYASVRDFSDDIQRFLDNRPVQARASTLSYRIGKFIRRNVAVTAVSAAAVSLMTVGTVVSFQRISAERDAALTAQRQAEAVSDFLQNIFYEAEPNNALGEALAVDDLLAAGKRQIEVDLKDQPETQLRMHRVLGETYYAVGNLDESTAQLDAAMTLAATLSTPNPRDVAYVKLMQSFIAQDRSDFDLGEQLLAEVRQLYEGFYNGDHVDIVEAIASEAHLLDILGEHDEALTKYREANDMLQRLFPNGNPRMGEILTKWAGVLRKEGRHDEAEPMLNDALKLLIAAHGELNLDVLDAKRHLAGLYRDTLRFEKSEPLYLQVIAGREKLLGPDAIELGHAYNSYSQMLQDIGELENAIQNAREFMRILDANHDGPNASYGAAYNNFAALQHTAGDYEDAIVSYLKSIEQQDAIELAPDHFHRSFPLYGMGNAYDALGRYDEAIALYHRALPMRQQAFDESHLFVSQVKVALASALFDIEAFEEADALVRDAHGYLLVEQGEDHPQTQRAQELIAKLDASGETG